MGAAKLGIADQHGSGPIDDAAGVARVVDMRDPLQMRVFHHRDLVEAGHGFAHILEGRLQGGERRHIGAGAHVFVTVQNGQAVAVGHRDDGFGKAVVRPGGGRPVLGFHGQGIRHLTGKAVFGGDDIGRNALRHEIGFHGEAWVHRNGGPVAAHGHAAHHLDPARDVGRARATAHLIGGKVHRLHAAGAKAVDGKAGDRLVKV